MQTMAVSLEPQWRSADDIEQMQLELLQSMIDACALRHPWYSKVFAECGIRGADLERLEDLERVPLTTKQTFIDNADQFRLEADPARSEDYVLADVTYTAGTSTGMPTPIFQTSYDLRAVLFAQRRMMTIRGVTRRDRVMNLYPLAPFPHGGWIRPTQAAASLGAPVVAATGGSRHHRFPVTRTMSEIIDLVVDTNPTIVWGVPSYVERVLSHVVEGKRSLPALRMIAVSGEPCSEARRNSMIELARKAGARSPLVSDSLGASELQFSLVECPGGRGFHHPAPELAHVDVVDDAGSSVADGTPGRLVYTHLDRTGTVLLRFLVGDRAVLDRSPCPTCGWAGGRVTEHLGREGNLRKIRGALVNIDAVHHAIESSEGVVGHRLELTLESGMDRLQAFVATDSASDDAAVVASVVDSVRRATGVRLEVTIAAREEIWSPDEELKPARFRDIRAREADGRSSK